MNVSAWPLVPGGVSENVFGVVVAGLAMVKPLPLAEATAFRSSSLQGAYLLLAARALGLAAGPMSGFDPARLNAAFFGDSNWTVNFLINLGYPDRTEPRPRASRLTFEEAVRVL